MTRAPLLSSRSWFLSLSLALAALILPQLGIAQESTLPLPSGLEPAVGFWKGVFTRYSINEVLFYDPLDPVTVYKVVAAPDNDEGRALSESERDRIMAEYQLSEDDGRVRSQRGAREQFISGMKLAGRYLPQMRAIFRDEGVPADLIYLPMIESAFNIHARSSVGALGMWQFMLETGKKFLRISEVIDERKDPVAASRAAARLLKENYKILGNWPLAVTAYNHGTEGILRGIETVGSRNLVDLIREYKSPAFGYASKNFYAELLAVVDLAKNIGRYFPTLRPHDPVLLREFAVRREVSLPALLKPAKITESQFFEWNPALNPNVKTIPTGYQVKVAASKLQQLAAAHRRIAESAPANITSAAKKRSSEEPIYHRVALGETLSKIAVRYRVSISALRQANKLSSDRVIAAGQQLKIPRG
jgi:membrane-bound lytic murein transglycosylase D